MKIALLIAACLGVAATEPQRGSLTGRRVGGGRPPRTRGGASPDLAVAIRQPTSSVILPSCAKEACSPGFSLFGDKCYKVMEFDAPLDFTTSQRRCQAEGSVLASDSSLVTHNFLKGLLRSKLVETVDSRFRRAFIGLMCQQNCDNSASWIYADGTKCAANNFCDWTTEAHNWNAVPTGSHGASIAAILDDVPDTGYRNKIQPYPVDHKLQYAVCQKNVDGTDHQKVGNMKVQEYVSSVEISWERPMCQGEIKNYIFVLLGGTTSFDTEIKCTEQKCRYELSPRACNDCIKPNVEYTFSIAPVMRGKKLGPAVTAIKTIDVETCPNFVTPLYTVSTCRGVSELIQDGSCEPQVTWSKGAMCNAVCEQGYGFFNQPADKYSCAGGGKWTPAGKAPQCYEIVPVFSANLQFKIMYKRSNIETLQHQFDGLVYKYNDIFCPYPEECGIGDLQIKSKVDATNGKMSEVIITIDTPVYNITDQAGFIDLVREAVMTVNEDNAFMTLIDYDNVALVLPHVEVGHKTEPMLCCHSCPEGHAYRLGNCVRCPPGGPCGKDTASPAA